MNTEYIYKEQIKHYQHLKADYQLKAGDQVNLEDGRIMELVRKMDPEGSAWIATEITDLENFDLAAYLNE